MPKIETPEEFAQKVKDYCFDAWTMNREQKQYMGEFLLDEAATLIASRDAAIRAESAALLKMCEEALEQIASDDYMLSIHEIARVALAALREAGVM